jgi:hypothetical protein
MKEQGIPAPGGGELSAAEHGRDPVGTVVVPSACPEHDRPPSDRGRPRSSWRQLNHAVDGQTIDTRSPTDKLMITMLGAIAEFERGLLLERQR